MKLDHFPQIGEVLLINETLSYVVNIVENMCYLYMDNKLVCWVIQHTADPELNDEYNIVNNYEIIDYCILPEIDYILKKEYNKHGNSINKMEKLPI